MGRFRTPFEVKSYHSLLRECRVGEKGNEGDSEDLGLSKKKRVAVSEDEVDW